MKLDHSLEIKVSVLKENELSKGKKKYDLYYHST